MNPMAEPVDLYRAIGGAAGCHAFATAFYAHVEQDPVLRPLFPSTFTCAIEAFSAFLVQFLGGEAKAAERRWFLSLRESHSRFAIGARERDAWLCAMTATLEDASLIADPTVRASLLAFFTHSSAHLVNQGRTPAAEPIDGDFATLWNEQLAVDEAVALAAPPEQSARFLELLQSPLLQARFMRSPAVHAHLLALAALSKDASLREYAAAQLRANPSLIYVRYHHGRCLLIDAAATGDLAFVELLLDLGAAEPDAADQALYRVGNECSVPGGGQIVRLLIERAAARVNAAQGVKRCTALHMAARRGYVEVIAALLDVGADIEARDSLGETPLRRAVNCGHVEAAKLLLARGADGESKGSRALTPKLAARTARMRELF